MNTKEDRLLSMNEVAEYLGISRRSIERMREKGDFIPPNLVRPKMLRWRLSAVNAWIDENGN